ncbi:Uncharacterized protein TCM_012335 [Theobroma cacao]|uniref:Uncharacterized protein n=1 Tax=Theobroma cacao TaxID=3641 RepID=A0A061FVA3_THECC|nr:Uncharacterized protein TCM_012335 [Theobroma cacao]
MTRRLEFFLLLHMERKDETVDSDLILDLNLLVTTRFEKSLKDDIAPNGIIKSIKPRTSSNRNFKVKLRVSQFKNDSKRSGGILNGHCSGGGFRGLPMKGAQ